MDAAEDFAFTVDGDVVMLLKAGDEMVGMSLANDFDAEVINDEIEGGGTCDVAEEPRGMASWDVAVVGEVFDEFYIGEAASLWKAIHAGADFGEKLFVFDEGAKIVFVHDVVGDGPFRDVQVFVLAGVVKRCDEVKV